MKGYCVIFLVLVFLLLFNQEPTIAIVGFFVIAGGYLLVKYKFGRFFGRQIRFNSGATSSESELLTYLLYKDYINNSSVFTQTDFDKKPDVSSKDLDELYEETENNFDYERQILESFDKVK